MSSREKLPPLVLGDADAVRPTSVPKWLYAALAFFVAVSVALAALLFRDSGNASTSPTANTKEAKVVRGIFHDAVALRGEAIPKRTVYIDAPVGGRVERVLVKSGASVVSGQPLIEMANQQLQLDTLSREAEVQQQLNNLALAKLSYEDAMAGYARQLIENEYQTRAAKRQQAQLNALARSDMARRGDLEDLKDKIESLERARALLQAVEASARRLRAEQLKELEAAATRLKEGRELARQGLEGLVIRASMAGVLSSVDAEPGQMKALGSRLGQIDDVSDVKVVALVDEFYLGKLTPRAPAKITISGKVLAGRVVSISTVVRDGRFPIEIESDELKTHPLSRGQSVQAEVQLGESAPALLIPTGPYLGETGGRWVYVLDDRNLPRRRDVVSGRRNAQFVEIKGGLTEGERVLVSPYAGIKEGAPLE